MSLALSTENSISIGLLVSIAGHMCFLLYVYNSATFFKAPIKHEVYSVSIVAGRTLGGVAGISPKKGRVTGGKHEANSNKRAASTVAGKKKTKHGNTAKHIINTKANKVKANVKNQQREHQKKVNVHNRAKTKNIKRTESIEDIDKELEKRVKKYAQESTNALGRGIGAGRIGGKGFGGGMIRPKSFFIYKELIEEKIKSEWRWIERSSNLTAQVTFKLREDGEILDVKITRSSGVKEYDESILRAVHKANPLPPPPKDVYHFFREVRITFTPSDE